MNYFTLSNLLSIFVVNYILHNCIQMVAFYSVSDYSVQRGSERGFSVNREHLSFNWRES